MNLRKIPKSLYLVFMILLLTIGMIAVLEKRALTNNTEIMPPNQVQAPLTSTDNWKTYVNTKWAYKFKYPNNWYIDEVTERITIILPLGIDAIPYIRNRKAISITVFINQQELPRPYFPSSTDKIETKEITVGGIKAEEDLLITFAGRWAGTIKWILVEKNGRFYKFIADTQDSETLEVFNQMLTTFEFID